MNLSRTQPGFCLALLAAMILGGGCTSPAPAGRSKSSPFPVAQTTFQHCFGNRQGCFILVRCSDGKTVEFNPAGCDEKLPPCSTFKIWNTLIGLETGLIDRPDAPFYQWDGQKRFMAEWNRDLTLQEAFRVSCVPAYQSLARRIGAERMQSWLDKIQYGDRDISAGIDVFWLSSAKRKTLLITPREQALLLRQLALGQLPFSPKSRATLETIMEVRALDHGHLYGKTGSGVDAAGSNNLGWFVGYLRDTQESYAYACVLQGENQTGKDARALVEAIVTESGWH